MGLPGSPRAMDDWFYLEAGDVLRAGISRERKGENKEETEGCEMKFSLLDVSEIRFEISFFFVFLLPERRSNCGYRFVEAEG